MTPVGFAKFFLPKLGRFSWKPDGLPFDAMKSDRMIELSSPGCMTKGLLVVGYRGLTLHGPYAWDGNSVKVRLGPLELGTSDGPLDTETTGEPCGKWPSCGHDVMYQTVCGLARVLGVSPWVVRSAADAWFRDEWLRRLSALPDSSEVRRWKWRVRWVYYPAVRLFGAAIVARRIREERAHAPGDGEGGDGSVGG